MATKFVTNLDLVQNQILNAQFEALSTDPSTDLFEGRLYYNTTDKVVKVYSGTAWRKSVYSVVSGNTGDLTAAESGGTVTLTVQATDANTANKIVKRDASGNFSAGTITANLTGQVSSIANHTTDALAEGSTNLYYTDARVQANRLDQLAAPTSGVSLNNQRITSLATPVDASDAATKGYVDAARSGLDVKASVRLTTTGTDIALSNTTTELDGVTLNNGDRVLVRSQTDPSQNGIYVVSTSGNWSRSADADSNEEVTGGLFTFVEEGATYADTGWVLTNNGTVNLGTDALTFAQFSGAGTYTGGAGLTLTGGDFSVNVDSTTIEIDTDILRIAAGAAGDGLTGGGGSALAVGAGDGITVGANTVSLASSAAGDGLTYTSGVLSVDNVAVAGGGTGATTASGARTNLAGDITVGAGQQNPSTVVLAKVFAVGCAASSGATSTTSVVHNFGTKDVLVQVFEASTGATVIADTVRTDTNTVTVTINGASIASNAYRIVVTG